MDTNGTAWRAQTVRRANLSTVLRAVRRTGRASRSQLVSATSLTRSAIGGLVAELDELGLVREQAAISDGSPGRPSQEAHMDGTRVGALAVEIAVDGIGAALVGLDGAVVHSRRMARPRALEPVDETVRDVVALLRALGAGSRTAGGRRLVGLGVAIAGLVDDTTNVVVRAPNLDWTDVALGRALTDSLELDLPVFVANDGDVGALAEARFGAAVGVSDMIFVSGEVGVGGGAFVAGRPVSGRSGFAGEIGHMPINPNGRPCRCGSSGCWETEVGELALLERWGHGGESGADALAGLLQAARSGETAALEALAEEARWLGLGIGGLINVFDPEMVVLGGFFGPILPMIGDQLRSEVEARVFLGADRTIPIVAAELAGDAGLIGAAELAFEPLLENPLMIRDSTQRT